MKYEVLENTDLKHLVKAVNAIIGNGWKPLGGIAINKTHAVASPLYLQALIYEEVTND